MDGITWEQFLNDINAISERSKEIGDNWEIVRANDDICGIYLRKKEFVELCLHKGVESDDMDFAAELMMSLDSTLGNGDASGNLSDSKELLSFEYHVLYHLSYAVPYICFNANKSNGSLMTFDEAWSTFNDPIYGRCGGHRMQMTTVLTQMEHPILFRPFLTVHPCRIAELLHCLPHSENKVLTFLSTIGPAVHLQFDLKYASILQKRIHK